MVCELCDGTRENCMCSLEFCCAPCTELFCASCCKRDEECEHDRCYGCRNFQTCLFCAKKTLYLIFAVPLFFFDLLHRLCCHLLIYGLLAAAAALVYVLRVLCNQIVTLIDFLFFTGGSVIFPFGAAQLGASLLVASGLLGGMDVQGGIGVTPQSTYGQTDIGAGARFARGSAGWPGFAGSDPFGRTIYDGNNNGVVIDDYDRMGPDEKSLYEVHEFFLHWNDNIQGIREFANYLIPTLASVHNRIMASKGIDLNDQQVERVISDLLPNFEQIYASLVEILVTFLEADSYELHLLTQNARFITDAFLSQLHCLNQPDSRQVPQCALIHGLLFPHTRPEHFYNSTSGGAGDRSSHPPPQTNATSPLEPAAAYPRVYSADIDDGPSAPKTGRRLLFINGDSPSPDSFAHSEQPQWTANEDGCGCSKRMWWHWLKDNPAFYAPSAYVDPFSSSSSSSSDANGPSTDDGGDQQPGRAQFVYQPRTSAQTIQRAYNFMKTLESVYASKKRGSWSGAPSDDVDFKRTFLRVLLSDLPRRVAAYSTPIEFLYSAELQDLVREFSHLFENKPGYKLFRDHRMVCDYSQWLEQNNLSPKQFFESHVRPSLEYYQSFLLWPPAFRSGQTSDPLSSDAQDDPTQRPLSNQKEQHEPVIDPSSSSSSSSSSSQSGQDDKSQEGEPLVQTVLFSVEGNVIGTTMIPGGDRIDWTPVFVGRKLLAVVNPPIVSCFNSLPPDILCLLQGLLPLPLGSPGVLGPIVTAIDNFDCMCDDNGYTNAGFWTFVPIAQNTWEIIKTVITGFFSIPVFAGLIMSLNLPDWLANLLFIDQPPGTPLTADQVLCAIIHADSLLEALFLLLLASDVVSQLLRSLGKFIDTVIALREFRDINRTILRDEIIPYRVCKMEHKMRRHLRKTGIRYMGDVGYPNQINGPEMPLHGSYRQLTRMPNDFMLTAGDVARGHFDEEFIRSSAISPATAALPTSPPPPPLRYPGGLSTPGSPLFSAYPPPGAATPRPIAIAKAAPTTTTPVKAVGTGSAVATSVAVDKAAQNAQFLATVADAPPLDMAALERDRRPTQIIASRFSSVSSGSYQVENRKSRRSHNHLTHSNSPSAQSSTTCAQNHDLEFAHTDDHPAALTPATNDADHNAQQQQQQQHGSGVRASPSMFNINLYDGLRENFCDSPAAASPGLANRDSSSVWQHDGHTHESDQQSEPAVAAGAKLRSEGRGEEECPTIESVRLSALLVLVYRNFSGAYIARHTLANGALDLSYEQLVDLVTPICAQNSMEMLRHLHREENFARKSDVWLKLLYLRIPLERFVNHNSLGMAPVRTGSSRVDDDPMAGRPLSGISPLLRYQIALRQSRPQRPQGTRLGLWLAGVFAGGGRAFGLFEPTLHRRTLRKVFIDYVVGSFLEAV